MKRIYQQPVITVVCVQNAQLLCNSIRSVESNADVSYGGKSSGPASARVKEQTDYNVWDDNWSQ